MTHWGVAVVGQQWVGVNQITRWMTRLPSWDRRGGDPLGLGFDGGEHIRNPLGFRYVVAGVGDGGVAIEMFRSMMVLPSGCSEAVVWLMPEPLASEKGTTPSVRPYN
jgi:hypothetical protein